LFSYIAKLSAAPQESATLTNYTCRVTHNICPVERHATPHAYAHFKRATAHEHTCHRPPACAVARTAGQQTEQRLYNRLNMTTHASASAIWRLFGCQDPAGPVSRHAMFGCLHRQPSRAPAGNVGMERFRRTRPARCTLRQRCKSNSCAQAIKQGVFGSLLGTAWLGSQEAGSHRPAASEPGSRETRSRFVSREPG